MGNFNLRDMPTGSDFADFLLGLPTLYTQGFSPAFYERSKYAGLYAQDSWRITPNLTLNYGLRWDLIMPWYEEHNQTGTLIPGEQSVVFPTAPTGYVFPGDPGVPTTIAPTRYNDFSPRLGLAYSPSWNNGFLKKLTGGPGNSSIRAGYGRFFTAIEGQTLAFETGNAPYGLTYTSPEHPLFSNPLIGAQTGTQYPQEFPVTVPPYNVSPKNPDSECQLGLLLSDQWNRRLLPRQQNSVLGELFPFLRAAVWKEHCVRRELYRQSGASPVGASCGQSW